MCREIITPKVIQGQRVRCAGKACYLPRNASDRLKQQIQAAITSGKMLEVELLQHYLIVRVYREMRKDV